MKLIVIGDPKQLLRILNRDPSQDQKNLQELKKMVQGDAKHPYNKDLSYLVLIIIAIHSSTNQIIEKLFFKPLPPYLINNALKFQ